jgi:hypothetical protein
MDFEDDELNVLTELLRCDDGFTFDEEKVEKVKALIEATKFLLKKYERNQKPIDGDKFKKTLITPLKNALDTLESNWKLFDERVYSTASIHIELLISQIEENRLDKQALDEARKLTRISRNNILYLFAEELLIYMLSLNNEATDETDKGYKEIVNKLIYREFSNKTDKRDYFRFSSKYKVFEITYQPPNCLCPPSIHRLDPINSLRKK